MYKSLLIVLLLAALAAPSVLAQPITGPGLDAPFERLDLSQTQTGILANRRAVLLDPGQFLGTADAETLVPMQWEVLYGQFRTSAADPASQQ